MKVAIVGGLCKDVFKSGGQRNRHLGGVVYNAISAAKNCNPDNTEISVITKARREDLEKFKQITERYEVNLSGIEDKETTVFETSYYGEKRVQIPTSLSSAIESFDTESNTNLNLIHFNPLFAGQISVDAIVEGKRKIGKGLISLDVQGFVRDAKVGEEIKPKAMEDAEEILENVDLLKLAEYEIEYVLSGLKKSYEEVRSMKDEIEGMIEIANHGPRIVELTLGRKGSLIYSAETDKTIFFPAFATEASDETGAGDTFATVFAINYANTRNVKDAAVYATVAASFCVEGKGYTKIESTEREEILKRAGEYRERILPHFLKI